MVTAHPAGSAQGQHAKKAPVAALLIDGVIPSACTTVSSFLGQGGVNSAFSPPIIGRRLFEVFIARILRCEGVPEVHELGAACRMPSKTWVQELGRVSRTHHTQSSAMPAGVLRGSLWLHLSSPTPISTGDHIARIVRYGLSSTSFNLSTMLAIIAKELPHDGAGILNLVPHMAAKDGYVVPSTSPSFLTDLLVLETSSREPLARQRKPQQIISGP